MVHLQIIIHKRNYLSEERIISTERFCLRWPITSVGAEGGGGGGGGGSRQNIESQSAKHGFGQEEKN